ncbi:MAG: 5-amino-6-(D-ribitylamino)uracil--L-tyrosine 4-hydroxyphenyl transferase CofH, partial [Gammaproteobacteria bacterium]|nr:5-amino-6-(D-ribitylamino)uracil--L-tyrosine 4-hydroxyphenyl transferase CofH [Gammaproteobacteria bacterium]
MARMMNVANHPGWLQAIGEGGRLDDGDAHRLDQGADVGELMATAAMIRDRGHGSVISYSRKVFIPLTRLCRDVCHYCTFARPPRHGTQAYLTLEEILDIARAGAAAGCREALFTLGDKPELRYRVARDELNALGYESTVAYLADCARRVFEETGLLPHANPGVLDQDDVAALREVCVSQGLMLESVSNRLCRKGGPHYRSPDKVPAKRLDTIRLAGELRVPFTSGILIGIGETRAERIDSLIALRRLHEQHGHLQELIIQNFRPKPKTPMANHPAAPLEELLWTVAVARLLFGPEMNIQAPPNLNAGGLHRLVAAGINDWGGVSPVTPDHVNPEAPWPHLDVLRRETEATGKTLVDRLAVYPAYVRDDERWLAARFRTPVRRVVDAAGYPRMDPWFAGQDVSPPGRELSSGPVPSARASDSTLQRIVDRALTGRAPDEAEVVRLFSARGRDFEALCRAADRLRGELVGDDVTYVVNRNINYTNICYFHCGFCAFSKGRKSNDLRGSPYDLDLVEIQRRVTEARARGATEVCMQGGIHPGYTGQTYIDICRAVKQAVPDMHVHAFSPLEVWQGAATLGIPPADFLARLARAGLGSLPGTAAEVLDDEVRAVLCPDKIKTDQWFEIMKTAHETGLRSTATIMFGHVDGYVHWARHLLRVLELQKLTRGFTEFVPLPFVHMQAPIYLRGVARKGPSFRESVLMHAVARLVFHEHIPNIQASWVKLGPIGLKRCLAAGANDVGGSLMNETITRSAGAAHGQEMPPERLEA